jgi:hypothetical protein
METYTYDGRVARALNDLEVRVPQSSFLKAGAFDFLHMDRINAWVNEDHAKLITRRP